MRRVVATLVVVVMVLLARGTDDVNGQSSCRFVLGFAALRDLVGSDKVGNCLEDEHFNLENGNSEQRTAGGLMVWRKIDNFTAFTDGGTTWVNGPNGLQSRPNGERFSWERDPVTGPTTAQGAPAANNPPAGASAPDVRPASAPVANAPANTSQASRPAPTATPTPGATATPAGTATPVKTATPTPNPIEAEFDDKPDRIDTGNDAHFVVKTNGKKGNCTLYITYRNTTEASLGTVAIDDGKCEWKWTLAPDTRTGEAKARVDVSTEKGTTSFDDTFEVRKGDTVYTGNVNVELDIDDLPDEVKVGQVFQVTAKANMKNKGSCELALSWPSVGATNGESKTPDGSGKCTWSVTVPAGITKRGTATVAITVRKDAATYRTVSKEIEVKTS